MFDASSAGGSDFTETTHGSSVRVRPQLDLHAVFQDVAYLARHGHWTSAAKRFGELRRAVEFTQAGPRGMRPALDAVARVLSASDRLAIDPALDILAAGLGWSGTETVHHRVD